MTGRPERHARRIPLALRLTGWTCEEDCEYHCMHQITNQAQARAARIRSEVRHRLALLSGGMVAGAAVITPAGRASLEAVSRAKEEELVTAALAALPPIQREMVQYHGKWVFVRFLGAQEPLSVLFSLANWMAHMHGLNKLWKHVPEAFPLKHVYLLYSFVALNAWFWSAVFHTRDRPLTEKLDYFGAGAAVLFLAFLTLTRLFRWSSRPATTLGSASASLAADGADEAGPRRRFWQLGLLCLVAYALHIAYLSRGRFDYQYNMAANVTVALVQLLSLLAYALKPSVYPGGWRPNRTTWAQYLPAPTTVLNTDPEEYELAVPEAKETLTSAHSGSHRPGKAHRRQHSQTATETSSTLPTLSTVSTAPAVGSAASPGPPERLLSPQTPTTSGPPWPLGADFVPLPQRRRILYTLAVAMVAASSLELLDFPALGRLLDAHALWHASTVPITLVWYHWQLQDARALTLRAGGQDPSVRPTTPDPTREFVWSELAPGEAEVTDDGEDLPWVSTDIWASYAGHRMVHPPWWTSFRAPRWRSGAYACLHQARIATVWAIYAIRSSQERGLLASFGAGVERVTDRLEQGWDAAKGILGTAGGV